MEGWDATLVPMILGGGLLAALVALYKAKPERDVSIATGYSTLVADLRRRIEDLETDLLEERAECDRRIDAIRDDFQGQLNELRRRFEDRIA